MTNTHVFCGLLRSYAAVILISTGVLLSACAGYDVTINDRQVYRPGKLAEPAVVEVSDPALRACIEQAMLDSNNNKISQLQGLNCSHAGIASLQGLEKFTGLQQLKLSANNISDIDELKELQQLRVLLLDDNDLIDPSALIDLPELERLDLSENKSLNCERLESLHSNAAPLSIEPPTHC